MAMMRMPPIKIKPYASAIPSLISMTLIRRTIGVIALLVASRVLHVLHRCALRCIDLIAVVLQDGADNLKLEREFLDARLSRLVFLRGEIFGSATAQRKQHQTQYHLAHGIPR
jgi:hypothetical protein